MATVNEMFVNLINEGIKATKTISDPKDKAVACAELAKAIATTGLVFIADSPTETSEDTAPNKEALKEKPKSKQAKKKETTAKETKEEVKETEETAEEPDIKEEAVAAIKETEVEIVDEWTDEMVELFSEQLAFVQQIQEEYDEETINEIVQMFSEGVLNSIEDITPLNIDGFIEYFNMLLEDAEAEEA